MINSIFQELLQKGIFENNFVILVKTKKELKERTIQFLKVAERYNYNLCFK